LNNANFIFSITAATEGELAFLRITIMQMMIRQRSEQGRQIRSHERCGVVVESCPADAETEERIIAG